MSTLQHGWRPDFVEESVVAAHWMTEKLSGCWRQPALLLGWWEHDKTLLNAGKPRLVHHGLADGCSQGAGGLQWPKCTVPTSSEAARWSLGPGSGCEVAEGPCILEAQLGYSSSRCLHTHTTDEACSRSQDKQHAALRTGKRSPWLLQCSLADSWRSLTLLTMKEQCLKSPLHYPGTGPEGWIWNWQSTNW